MFFIIKWLYRNYFDITIFCYKYKQDFFLSLAKFSTKESGVKYVIANDCWSIAIYCQRCGKIQIHELSYFEQINKKTILRCSCGHHQATIVRTVSNRFQVEIPCVVCDFVHRENFIPKSLVKMKAEKIYCAKDHFELGYVGKKQKIEEILAFNKKRFALLNQENNESQIETQQILLDILNRLHDIAESDGINCQCGSKAIAADIIGNSVILECCHCGGYYIVPAKSIVDIDKINRIDQIDLMQGRFLIKNIDLD